MKPAVDAVFLAIGAAGALATERAARRLGHRRRVITLSLELAMVAAIYPACRTGWRDRAPVVREMAGLTAYSAAAAIGMARANTHGHQIIAIAWMTHAVFDALHHRGPNSRLPNWYPAVCAGYDVALGALLTRG